MEQIVKTGGNYSYGNDVIHKGQDYFENRSVNDFAEEGISGYQLSKNLLETKMNNYRLAKSFRYAMSERSGYSKKQKDGNCQCNVCNSTITYFTDNEYYYFSGCGHTMHISCGIIISKMERKCFIRAAYLQCPLCSIVMLNCVEFEKINNLMKKMLNKKELL